MRAWLKGLAAAALGAGATGAAAAVQNKLQNPAAPSITGRNVGITAGMGALVAAIAYLAQSPLPAEPSK